MNNLSNEQIHEIMAALLIVPTSKVNGVSFDKIAKGLGELLAYREAQGKPVVCEYGESNGDGSYSVVYGRYPIPSYIKVSPDWPIKLFCAVPQLPAVIGWINEDELPENYPYDKMFPFSKVDIIRMFPVYAPQLPDLPELLPCTVKLEPGLTLGKGVKTQALLDALIRREKYYAELEAMTPEQRAEKDKLMDELRQMLGHSKPTDDERIMAIEGIIQPLDEFDSSNQQFESLRRGEGD